MFKVGQKVVMSKLYRWTEDCGIIRDLLMTGGSGLPNTLVATVEFPHNMIYKYPVYQLEQPDLRHFIKEALDKQGIMCYT